MGGYGVYSPPQFAHCWLSMREGLKKVLLVGQEEMVYNMNHGLDGREWYYWIWSLPNSSSHCANCSWLLITNYALKKLFKGNAMMEWMLQSRRDHFISIYFHVLRKCDVWEQMKIDKSEKISKSESEKWPSEPKKVRGKVQIECKIEIHSTLESFDQWLFVVI